MRIKISTKGPFRYSGHIGNLLEIKELPNNGKVTINSNFAAKKSRPWRTLPSTALRVLVNCFVIVDEVGFKQDAGSRDRILESDARNDHFPMVIMTIKSDEQDTYLRVSNHNYYGFHEISV